MNPRRLKPYKEAERIKLQNENYLLWLSGYYQYEAVSTAIHNAFREKNTRAQPYLKEPIEIFEPTEEELEERAEIEREKVIAFFTAMERKYNREGGGGDG